MYQHSKGIVFDSPAGWTTDNLECNPLNAYIILNENVTSISQGISELFPNHPCEDIEFRCNKTNNCTIKSINNANGVNIDTFQPFFNCYYPIYFAEASDILCQGNCPNSPTLAPTRSPTFDPTETTDSPSFSPSIAPSSAPSFSPSSAPTSPPSTSPSFSPSIAPTISPSKVPSSSPLQSPTNTPSESPTTAPSNHPIASHDFDSSILITYVIDKLRPEDKAVIYANPDTEIHEIESIISRQYLIPNLIYSENYLLQILDIDGVTSDEIDANTQIHWTAKEKFEFNAQVECDHYGEKDVCSSILVQSRVGGENDFQAQVQDDLRSYTGNSELTFKIRGADSLVIDCKDCKEERIINYVLYVIIAMVGLIVLISIFALLFNSRKFPKLPGFSRVDDGKWASLLMFALQFWLSYIC